MKGAAVNEEYRQKATRSRRNASSARSGRVVGVADGEVQLSLPMPKLLAATHGAIESLAGEAGLLVMKALIDEEIEQLAGRRYEHEDSRSRTRWGSEEGYVVFAGRKVPMRRPRVRAVDGKEVALQRYGMFQDDSRMRESVVGRVLRRVSMRDYAGVVDDICDGYGVEKSSVSRHWKAATVGELAALMERRLDELELAVIMIDGVHFHEFTLCVALGIALDGRKHVLGIWDGATENSAVVTALLENLLERGLARDRRYLFVIDGSKALRKAMSTVFGKHAAVQRCQIHKERNVLGHLPDRHQGTIRRALRAAWGMKTHADAKKALEQLASKLDGLSPGAAASLREGLEETITLHRLNVHEELRHVVQSTNAIENIFSRTRDLCRNVKRWSSADMALRWASTMLLYAEKKFRRVIGYERMPGLVEALAGLDKMEAVA
jgi:putative transposase